jgi:hypothetical protein
LQSSAKFAPRFVTYVLSNVKSIRTSIADVAPRPVNDVRKNVEKWPRVLGQLLRCKVKFGIIAHGSTGVAAGVRNLDRTPTALFHPIQAPHTVHVLPKPS